MNPMQAVQLDILKEFARVMTAEKLTWFAGFGTLLGASRCSGFIPWDDDIDVLMPRAEYDKLRNNFHVFAEPYFLQTPQNDPAAAPRFMRLRRSDTAIIPEDFPNYYTPEGHMGIYIDIIPLDSVSDIIVSKHMQSVGATMHRRMYGSAAWEENGYNIESMPKAKEEFVKKSGGFPGFYKTYAAMYEEVFNGFPEGGYYAMPVLKGERGWRVYDKEWFSQTATLTFEDIEIPVPKEWRAVLAVAYPNGTKDLDLRYHHPPQKAEETRLIDVHRSYRDYARKYTDMLKDIEGKSVYIFGAGDSLRIWLERYSQGLDVVCAFDNGKDKHGTTAYGVTVNDPAILPSIVQLREGVRLIIASIYYKEISAQLETMGIHDYYVFIDGWKYRR